MAQASKKPTHPPMVAYDAQGAQIGTIERRMFKAAHTQGFKDMGRMDLYKAANPACHAVEFEGFRYEFLNGRSSFVGRVA